VVTPAEKLHTLSRPHETVTEVGIPASGQPARVANVALVSYGNSAVVICSP
jgi:hypothetical protein